MVSLQEAQELSLLSLLTPRMVKKRELSYLVVLEKPLIIGNMKFVLMEIFNNHMVELLIH